MAAIPLQHEIYYPESDGKPMAESDIHRDVMFDLIHALQARYEGERDVYVGGNLLFYFVEGDPRSSISPDVFLVRGVPKGRRKTYLLWKEGKAPDFVVEVTSDSTRQEDLQRKKERYESLGVEEYILFDPLGDYLDPRLRGYRLTGRRYRPIAPESDGSLLSRTTSLRLRPEGENLRLVDATTGECLLGHMEETTARREAEERARSLEERARSLEEEIDRLRRPKHERNERLAGP
jgi:Uma2 family endonuclease